MKLSLLALLACPGCGAGLRLAEASAGNAEIETGQLRCEGCRSRYPVYRSIPRFVPAENYAASFGFQWTEFRRTQLDSHSGTTISHDRFFCSTGWNLEELRGRRILDVGCGSGRFAEVALASGAEVVAVDYSNAVEPCRENLGGRFPLLHVVQGDIYHLPFQPGSFDFVYCLGVLQHTPDVAAAFRALPPHVRPGGKLAIDIYPKSWRTLLTGKYWLRPITKHIRPCKLFAWVQQLVPQMLPLSRVVGRVPLGKQLRRVLPIANYEGIHPLSEAQIREWAVLDTFDMLAPAHDHPQTPKTLRRWLEEAGLRDVEVFKHGHLVGRGIR